MYQKKKCGLYIHVPYCQCKCLYCDFFSGGSRGADWGRFCDALTREIHERRDQLPYSPTTIYIGGGTPSLMPAESLKGLTDSIADTFGGIDPEEFTIEANPDDVCQELIDSWQEAGINRVSLGVQSLVDEELKAVGRRHTAETARRALRMLRPAFGNISADLIFGLPGQTMESFRYSVESLLELRPDHISAYSLMYEEGTALTALVKAGRMTRSDEDLSVEMFSYLTDRLRTAGFRRYEISNYARPGYESRHNSAYWYGLPYLGLGPSAHSYDGRSIRRANPCDIRGYLDRFSPIGDGNAKTGSQPFYSEEQLTEEEQREEMILTRMRTAEGLDLEEYEARWGADARRRLLRNAVRGLKSGQLLTEQRYIRLTDAGVMTIDDLIVDLAL